jgi:hypothetical protein
MLLKVHGASGALVASCPQGVCVVATRGGGRNHAANTRKARA